MGTGVFKVEVAGELDAALSERLQERLDRRLAAGTFSRDDVAYIKKLRLDLIDGTLRVNPETLERLRRLCRVADVDIRIQEISSHRRWLGPVIVAVKKLLYPMLRVLLRDFIRQQRSFNMEVAALLAQLAGSNERDRGAG